MKTITCKVVIPIDRQLKITIPEDVPPGPAEVVVVIVPEARSREGRDRRRLAEIASVRALEGPDRYWRQRRICQKVAGQGRAALS